MKIVIAPNPFKNCLTGMRVCELIEEGFKRVWPEAEYVKIPMADGGDGTLDALVEGTSGRIVETVVKGPLRRDVTARLGILGDNETAVIEMAEASGLRLISSEDRNPFLATSYGTGQLIRAALEQGVKKIIVGIGGSATVDGGAGMAQALGACFYDASGEIMGPYAGGKDLANIESIDLSQMDPRIRDTEFLVACDVTNPLCGPKGAAAVFGPQKGAETPEIIKALDDGLRHFSEVIQRTNGKDVLTIPGGGAAGGMGAALVAFVNARLLSGINLIMEATRFEKHMEGASFVVTGEGNVDSQTLEGKAPAGIAEMAAKHKVPVLVVGGGLSDDASRLHDLGCAIFSVTPRPMSLADAMKGVEVFLPDAAQRTAYLVDMGMRSERTERTERNRIGRLSL